MTDNIKAWPKATGRPNDLPKQIVRPCDYGLMSAWTALETQLGTIEGYNRLCKMAEQIKKNIDAGQVQAQNPLYAKNIKGG